ncbi:sugar ABC transporter substrate-binding protein [Paenibacillus elgii]|uniref:Sugar ABC transporter substrate-binding protein n=1 Tax=Paenibacillus elgii TaxID=189691 RepID=A0A2T6FUE4_9BACL|nr:sugar ABC transporter substrate-binding protein [Paenibacillus elgii]PUA35533.1 sugar ABC transporter substrate-binding protein [Paenibacillus elgii]
MKRNKTACLGAILLTGAVLLPACASDTKDGGSKGDSTVTITQFVPDVPDKTFVEKLVPEFEAKHPNIKVKIMKTPYEEFDSKLQAMIAAGTTPDVTSHWGEGGFIEYYDKGLLRDLTDLMKEDNFKASDYGIPDNLMDIYKIDGKNYGIPVYSYVTMLLYNKDMFDKAGVPYPPSDYEDKSWTFDKMVETAKKLSKPSDDFEKVEFGMDWVWGEKDMRPVYFGAKVYSDDTWTNGGHATSFHFNSPEVVKINQRLSDLILKDKVMPSPEFTKAVAGQGGDPFATGRVGMSVAGAWILASVKDYSFKVGVAAVPYSGSDKNRNVLYVDPLLILKDSKHPKEAYEWIKFQLGKDIQEKSIELSGGTPPANQQAAEKYFSLYSPTIDAKDMKNVVEGGLKYGVESYNHLITHYSEILNIVKNELDLVDNGQKTVAEVSPQLEKKVNDLLKEKNAGKASK